VKSLAPPIFVLVALVAVLAGCGGGSSSSGTTTNGSNTTGGGGGASATGGVSGIKVGDCLNNNEDFLVQPSEQALDGQSPAGVGFTLTLYKNAAAAQAAGAKKSKKTTAVVENGVIDFRGNPTIYAGAPAAKISQSELSAIKRCIDQTRGQ
jgi:hypothetical protein